MSKVQGGTKCVKYLLFVFNFIFWVSLSLLKHVRWIELVSIEIKG